MQDQSDNVYYSFTVRNDDTSGRVKLARFSSQETNPLLYAQENWKLAIVKFSCPANFPLFSYVPGSAEINLRYLGNDFNIPIVLTNYLRNVPPAISQPQTIQNNNTFGTVDNNGPNVVKYFQQFVQAINYALELSLAAAIAAFPALAGQIPPYFSFDETTQLFSLTVDGKYNPLDAAYNNIEILSNAFIQRLFSGLPVYFDAGAGVATYNRYRYLVYESVPVVGDLVMTAQFSSVSYWFTAKRLVMVSNRLKVNPESIGNEGGRQEVSNIITEFSLNFTTSLQEQTTVTYQQIGEKDLIDITGTGPLTDIDITMFYNDDLGNQYPVLLTYGQIFEVKLKFIRVK